MGAQEAESFAERLIARRATEARLWTHGDETKAQLRSACDLLLAEHGKVR